MDITLTKTRIQAGAYEGVLKAAGEGTYHPNLSAVHLEREMEGLTVTEDSSLDATWLLRFEIPSEVLTDGVQTFMFMDKDSGATLDSFTVLTGEVMTDDIRAEMDLLRAELDMLKKAFRRHCVETM